MPVTYEPIASYTLSSPAASVTFSSIPQSYSHLIISASGSTELGGTYGFRFRANGDTSNAYHSTLIFQNNTTFGHSSNSNLSFANFSLFSAEISNGICHIFDYASTSKVKSYIGYGGLIYTGNVVNRTYVGAWNSTSAITSLEIFADTSNLYTKTTVTLFGLLGA